MKRGIFTVCLMLAGGLICSAQQTTFYFPQVADGTFPGGFWKTTLFLSNPTATSMASVTITLTQSNGNPFNVSFVDDQNRSVGSGNQIPVQIAPGQTRKFVSAAATPLAVGFATVSSNVAVTGTAVFSQFAANGRLISEAGVPSATPFSRQAIFVDTRAGFRTGVAIANPNTALADITLGLFNTEGQSVMPTTGRTLAANQHTAGFVHELFSGAPEMAGTMRITSQNPLATVALRFDPSFTLFTTLPPFQIASLIQPVIGWLDARPWLAPLSSIARLMGALQIRLG